MHNKKIGAQEKNIRYHETHEYILNERNDVVICSYADIVGSALAVNQNNLGKTLDWWSKQKQGVGSEIHEEVERLLKLLLDGRLTLECNGEAIEFVLAGGID